MTAAPNPADANAVRADEDLETLRARMAATAWPSADIARVDAPILVEMEAVLALAQAQAAEAEALAARLFQSTVTLGERVQSLTAAVALIGKTVRAARTLGLAQAQRHAETLKA